ncbi:hypothetical protein ARTHRO9AX_180518 [Arthrobacter sp. 9AX]|nr:hypothetical protein ARTHRO9AX_180518 [Arthrobacter sp. 9AX]
MSSSRDRAFTAPIPGTPREAPSRPLRPRLPRPRRPQRHLPQLPPARASSTALFDAAGRFVHIGRLAPVVGIPAGLSVGACLQTSSVPAAALQTIRAVHGAGAASPQRPGRPVPVLPRC